MRSTEHPPHDNNQRMNRRGFLGGALTALAGAAAGATSATMAGIFGKRDPAPIHRAFVEQCLADHGYRTIGWD